MRVGERTRLVESPRIDALAKEVAATIDRRSALRGPLAAGVAALLLGLGVGEAAACTKLGRRCAQGDKCCGGAKCKGGRCTCGQGKFDCTGKCQQCCDSSNCAVGAD